MSFNEILLSRIEQVDQHLICYLPTCPTTYNTEVLEAMKYSLMAGGKRLRPLIMEAVYEHHINACRDTVHTTYESHLESDFLHAFSTAMEMIHTYSLIHDDLPAMDDDDLRRGKPTCHIQFSEAMAILAGDALLNRAFEIMTDATLQMSEPIIGLKAMSIQGEASGTNGMIGGQVADILSENTINTQEVIDYIHHHKTGCMIEAAFMMGAQLAGCDTSIISQYQKIGCAVGLAFQIQDDLLDIIGNQELLGKPLHSDEKNQKVTYVTLHGIENSQKTVEALFEQAFNLLIELKYDSEDFLVVFLKTLEHRKK